MFLGHFAVALAARHAATTYNHLVLPVQPAPLVWPWLPLADVPGWAL